MTEKNYTNPATIALHTGWRKDAQQIQLQCPYI